MDIREEGFDIRGIKPKYGPGCDRYEQQVYEVGMRKMDVYQYGVKGKSHSSGNLHDNPTVLISSYVRMWVWAKRTIEALLDRQKERKIGGV